MTIEVRVPQLPESVADATLVAWHKQPGDIFRKGETLYEIESEKVTMEVDAPCDGKLLSHTVESGGEATVGGNVCVIDTDLSA